MGYDDAILTCTEKYWRYNDSLRNGTGRVLKLTTSLIKSRSGCGIRQRQSKINRGEA